MNENPFVFDETGEAKRFAPATARNRDAIAAVLAAMLPPRGTVLEIASGTGEHLVHFAANFPALAWQPSDYDAAGVASIAAWSTDAGLPNILPPLRLDAAASVWPVDRADAILCINMIHIAPWAATKGLFEGAGRVLPTHGMLYLYGPYRETDVATVESNEAFDMSLKDRNPDWGLRHVQDVASLALHNGFMLDKRVAMPANNLSLVFRKA
jgi:cyclopropane fatty-acyl-phospholipid synthase-like methyltransferase